ncbi:MAG: energy transducer TonB [Elusimicrobia bacterium]|nr:energy transducer TonB [Elusimicrobiota bacterium]
MGILRRSERARDIASLMAACLIHTAVLSANPTLYWAGSHKPPPTAIVSVDFVAAPPPTPTLAPMPGGQGREGVPRHGPGAYRPERVAKPKTPIKTKNKQKTNPRAKALAAERKARAEALAAERAAQAREKALRLAQERAERAQRLAEMKAEKVRQKALLEQEIASLRDPDEVLSDAPNDSNADEDVAPTGSVSHAEPGLAPAKGGLEGVGSGAEPVYDLEAEGRDQKYRKASGGGLGPNGGGLSWSIDGPAGNRRLIRRVLPQSPDWVSKRGLELTVEVKFQVLEDGSVKLGAVIRKTSGFPEIDQLALEALKKWKFESIPARPDNPATWGTVTFHFLMS